MVLNDKRKNNIKPLNIILTSIKYNSFTQIRGNISKLATFGGVVSMNLIMNYFIHSMQVHERQKQDQEERRDRGTERKREEF